MKKAWLGLAVSPDGARAYLAGAGGRNVLVYRLEGDRFAAEPSLSVLAAGEPRKLDAAPSGLAVSPDGKSLWAARILLNDVVRIDLATGAVAAVVARRPPSRTGPSSRRTARSSRSRTGGPRPCRSSTRPPAPSSRP